MNTPHPPTSTHAYGSARAAQPSTDAVTHNGVGQMRANAAPALHELAASAKHLARSGASAVCEHAVRARDVGTDYVRGHPLQAVLIATGVGAAMVILMRLFARRGSSSH